MTKREKTIRLIISGAILVVVVLTALTVYQSRKFTNQQNEELAQTDENKGLTEEEKTDNQNMDSKTQKTESESTNVSASDVEAVSEEPSDNVEQKSTEDTSAQQENTDTKQTQSDTAESTQENGDTTSNENTDENADGNTDENANENAEETQAQPTLAFTEETLLEWPVSGSVIMDYSMDHAVYFSTLNVYKYNPALIVSAQVDEPVKAVADSVVLSIEEQADTGVTVTMDMGNGYHAVYGQLKDVMLEVGQYLGAGETVGNISEPTKYYTKEGTNLYFSMTKDDESIDPVQYLP